MLVGRMVSSETRSLLVVQRITDAFVSLCTTDSTYTTPMPCRILQLIAKDGATVKAGDGILVMESMKTEIKLLARSAGKLKLLVKEGDT